MEQVSDKEIIDSSLNPSYSSNKSIANILNIKKVNLVFDEPTIIYQRNSDVLTDLNNQYISNVNKHKRSFKDDFKFPYGSFIHSIYSFSSYKFTRNKSKRKLATRIIIIIIIITVLAIVIVIILVVSLTTKSEIFNMIQKYFKFF